MFQMVNELCRVNVIKVGERVFCFLAVVRRRVCRQVNSVEVSISLAA
jgi:hypothetical protein